MTDSLIETEIVAACSGLGYSDGLKYRPEAECFETVKDLIRYLRRDDDSHEIRRALGQIKVLQTDLIPIIKFCHKEIELFDVTLRLLVNLTHPVMLLFKEELPEEKITRQQYLQLISQQQAFKEAFADERLWEVLINRLSFILNKDLSEREEEEGLVAERILILIRNVLVIAASPEQEKRTDDDASVHDQVLWALHLSRFEDLILYISSSRSEEDLCMHAIEIISLILKEQGASILANTGLQRMQSEKQKDEQDLLRIRSQEAAEKKEKAKKHYSARHSRFGGTYYINNMKSISDRTMIAHKHISNLDTLSFDHSKRAKKISKNRLPLSDAHITRKSTLAIRLFLREFCVEFLNGAFNLLMKVVKDRLDRARAQEHDESYYLWAMQFFLEFNRSHEFRVELITETLNIHSFHYIHTLLENYYEMMVTDKKKIPLWSRRMHRALNAYKELLITLSFMDKDQSENVRQSSRILKNKVFYVVEYRELVLTLLQNFDEIKMSKGYLRDLIETAHTFLKLLEGLCGKQRHLVVENKKKMRKKAKIRKPSKPERANVAPTQEQLIVNWDEKSDDLLAVVKGEKGELPSKIPYDPISETPESEQKENAVKEINLLLRKGALSEAVSLLRSARDIWPQGNVFCPSDPEPLDEISCLREIFMANINTGESFSDLTDNTDQPNESDGLDSDEEQERVEVHVSEQDFDFIGFVRRFSHIKVMQAYALIFKSFLTNSEHINHCILRMFHRLAWDCKIEAIFFQASLFRTFQIIMDYEHSDLSQSHKDARKFVKFIIRKFIEIAQENEKVFLHLLFWKTNKQALEIECGFTGQQASSTQTKSSAWTYEEEDELRRLFEELKDSPQDEKDIADLITDNLINQKFTRRNVISKLKELKLIENAKELKKKMVRTKKLQTWSEGEIDQLKNLVSEFKDAVNPIAIIMDHLSFKRPRKHVIDKIMELELVTDRSALLKKKRNRSHRPRDIERASMSPGSVIESCSSQSDSDSENGNSRPNDRSSLFHQLVNRAAPTPELISSCLDEAKKEGLGEAIKWVAELILETADEREADDDMEAVPLFAMTKNNISAMENVKFLELLKNIGIQPPSSHEEMFWRIPSHLSVGDLRKRGHYLLQERSNDTERTDDSENPTHTNSDATLIENGVTVTISKDISPSPSTQSSNDEMNDHEDTASVLSEGGNDNYNKSTKRSHERSFESKTSVKKNKKRRIINESDSDDDSNDTTTTPAPIIPVPLSNNKNVYNYSLVQDTADFPQNGKLTACEDEDEQFGIRATRRAPLNCIDDSDDE